MAKSMSFFGLRKGSTKSLTFQVLKGRQITKDRVIDVKNPQSTPQMIQRVSFATATKAAEVMRDLIEISQQGVSDREYARQAFIAANVKFLREQADSMNRGGSTTAAFAPKGCLQMIPNSYIVSNGSLQLPYTWDLYAKGMTSFGHAAFETFGTCGDLPYGEYTAAKLWRVIFGLLPGDQLSFPQIFIEGIAQVMVNASGLIADNVRFAQFCVPRIVLKTTMPDTTIVLEEGGSTAEIKTLLLTGIDTDQSWPIYNNIIDNLQFTADEDGILCSIPVVCDQLLGVNDDDHMAALAVILSRKDSNGTWKYSTSRMLCTWVSSHTETEYFGFTLPHAISTYMKKAETASNGNFLQSGGDADILPPSFT